MKKKGHKELTENPLELGNRFWHFPRWMNGEEGWMKQFSVGKCHNVERHCLQSIHTVRNQGAGVADLGQSIN